MPPSKNSAAGSSASFGVVFTAHPTFSISLELARALAEVTTHAACNGAPLDDSGRAAHLAVAAHMPHMRPNDLTLDTEHRWSVEALRHAHTALDCVNRAAFRIARTKWPDRWDLFDPRMITLATRVGYDQDGRTDITWDAQFCDPFGRQARRARAASAHDRGLN
jgi:phosphoenolpyruvate carboxylase